MLVVKKSKNFSWNFEKFQETICNNNCRRPTQRALDGGDCPKGVRHFPAFSGFEFFLLPNIVHARPAANNDSRWAASASLEFSLFPS
jgi:hypothetical protein